MVGQIIAVYNKRDFWKHGPYMELIILNIVINYTWPLRAVHATYLFQQSLLFTYTPNTFKP